MGYFPNGTAGDMYETEYCQHCIHGKWFSDSNAPMCAVMDAHMLRNYEECNDDDSILHILIPRDKDGWNEECKMFIQVDGR